MLSERAWEPLVAGFPLRSAARGAWHFPIPRATLTRYRVAGIQPPTPKLRPGLVGCARGAVLEASSCIRVYALSESTTRPPLLVEGQRSISKRSSLLPAAARWLNWQFSTARSNQRNTGIRLHPIPNSKLTVRPMLVRPSFGLAARLTRVSRARDLSGFSARPS